jgi:hypothetical protein
MNQEAIDRLVASGRLAIVPTNPDRARVLLAQARKHLESADAISASDPSLAYVALYDAARKAILAHMLAHGYREAARPGAHQAVIEYALAALGDSAAAEALARLNRLRRNRNRSEYESWEPSPIAIKSDLKHASEIVTLVETLLTAQ